ncbi:MAG: thioredoxin family protein [Candidatus Pristimantibacillus sp.]
MEQKINLQHVVGKGILQEQFMESMQERQMPLNGITNTKVRCREIYKGFTWGSEEDKQFFSNLGDRSKITCFILCTDWCPDVIWNVPVLFRVMEHARIPTEVLVMEEHLETMNHFLTNGGRAQPIAVFLDEIGNVLGRWGARPAYIQAVMDGFKQSFPDHQGPYYEEKLNQTYKEIGDLYRSGSTYQDVMIQELREIVSRF